MHSDLLAHIGDIGISPVNEFRDEFGRRCSSKYDGNLQSTSRESHRNVGYNGDYIDRLTNSGVKMINIDLSENKKPGSAETRASEGDITSSSIKHSGIRGVFMREHITQNEIMKQNDQKKIMRDIWESQINEKKRKKEEEKLKEMELSKKEEEKMKKEFEQQQIIENDIKRNRLNKLTLNSNFANVATLNTEKEQQIKYTKANLGTLDINKNEENSSNELLKTGNSKPNMTLVTDQDEQIRLLQGKQNYFILILIDHIDISYSRLVSPKISGVSRTIANQDFKGAKEPIIEKVSLQYNISYLFLLMTSLR